MIMGVSCYEAWDGYDGAAETVHERRPDGSCACGQYKVRTPDTYEGTEPAALVGELIAVRPYYSVPTGRSGSTPARSPFTVDARVTGTHGTDQVIVRFTRTDAVPWKSEAAFFPREMHRAGKCACMACVPGGPGIAALRGA